MPLAGKNMAALRRKFKAKKIGVLMGGVSEEREISLRSGTSVLGALKERGYRAVAIDTEKDAIARIRKAAIDVAFIALHGRYGEDGMMQGTLEMMGIPYTGSGVMACAVGMDKAAAKVFFKDSGVPTPGSYVATGSRDKTLRLKLPVIVKPNSQGSTIGVSVVRKKSEYAAAVCFALKHGTEAIVEEFVEGREFTVAVLGSTVFPVIEIRPKAGIYDFKAKYVKGMTEFIVPAKLAGPVERKVKDAALGAYESLGCSGAARVDVMLDKKNRPYVLEVNTSPGMTSLSLFPKAAAAVGLTYPELVERMLFAASLKGK
ncbi:MAG: D-alanine--D-alanine ligase [Deltaproteobacteria bacterium]|nr:D-alanine--D-alanine ligase [Deltaproteobacteria bacterium]